MAASAGGTRGSSDLRFGEDDTHGVCSGERSKYQDEECVESSLEINHLYHPRHPLHPSFSDSGTDNKCYCCRGELGDFRYYCSICDFSMNLDCAMKPAIFDIHHPKCHDHTLTVFLRRVSFTCNACALVEDGALVYVCLRCDFMVHKECIYLPRVIKMSRHRHRLSHRSSLLPQELLCGVCRRPVDRNLAGYSCDKGCSYVVHSKCATRKDVWDGKELEDEPEDDTDQIIDDVEPFQEIAEGIIRHFSHPDHHLRFEKGDNIYDERKRCQACSLHIHHDGNFYSCTQCDFILHERCANLPRRKQHPLHPHQLCLEIEHGHREDRIDKWTNRKVEKGYSSCSTCSREFSGFVYKCPEKECRFTLDVRCASIDEPFTFEGHPHSLYLTSKPDEICLCQACQQETTNVLNCIECDFALCFKCATLPYRVRYKYDEHLFTFCSGEAESGLYWCELCEEILNQKTRFYTCDDCCITLHIECLLGKYPYMKPGRPIWWEGRKFDILSNNSVSRPICNACGRRCRYNIVFKISYNVVLCSLYSGSTVYLLKCDYS